MLHGNCQCIRSPVRCSCLYKIPRQMESVICPTLVFKILCQVEVLVLCFKPLSFGNCLCMRSMAGAHCMIMSYACRQDPVSNRSCCVCV